MRTIGNVERFLVIGIVVVIGAILAVAIRGADDLEGNYKRERDVASAKAKAGDDRRSGESNLRVDAPRTNPSDSRDSKVDGTRGTPDGGTSRLSNELEDLLRRKDLESKPTGHLPNGTKSAKDGALAGSNGLPASSKKDGDAKGDAAAGDVDAEDDSPPIVVTNRPPAPDAGPGPGHPVVSGDAPVATDWYYEVQSGDRLERIAATLYGERSYWRAILAANPTVDDPARIRAGQKLKLPKAPKDPTAAGVSQTTAHDGEAAAVANPRRVVKVDVPAAPVSPDAKAANGKVEGDAGAKSAGTKSYKRVTASDEYEVKRGDTLMAIAAAHYGTRSAWRVILAANTERIPDKDHIKPGIVLKLPSN